MSSGYQSIDGPEWPCDGLESCEDDDSDDEEGSLEDEESDEAD